MLRVVPILSMALGICCSCDILRASAATTTANLAVQLSVTASCTTSAAPLDFGSLNLMTIAADATSTISVTCTNATPYSVGLDNGANYLVARRMRLGATLNYILYDLYTDAGRTNIWTTTTASGSCTSGASSCGLGTGNGSAQSLTVYGRVPVAILPAQGTFADTILVTVTY